MGIDISAPTFTISALLRKLCGQIDKIPFSPPSNASISFGNQSSFPSFSSGKLLMQSDIDMASASLSQSLHDLDLLLQSGVLHHSNAIVLSHPGPSSTKEDLGFFVRDLFTRLQIGGIKFKKKALESLLQLLAQDDNSPAFVAKEGNIGYLIHLLDFNDNLIREHASEVRSVRGLCLWGLEGGIRLEFRGFEGMKGF